MTLPLLTGAGMRSWERRCFGDGAISERVVMESAGRAAAAAIARHFPEGRVVAAVGRGNNGGDAIVALRTLKAWGREVAAVGVGADVAASPLAHGWEIPIVEGPHAFQDAGLIVDGLLGTGGSGAPREPIAGSIAAIAESGVPVVALDGPSGVDLTTGAVPGAAVRAALTVTFGALKRGLLLHPGRQHAGRVLLAEVGFPPFDGEVEAAVVTDAYARGRLPRIAPDAHKGRVGLVAVAAGRRGVGGAAVMASMGALRAGAGGVRVVSTEENRPILQVAVPEAIFVDRADAGMEASLAGVRAILVGPGIGTGPEARDFLARILTIDAPAVLDADALTILAEEPGVLTPDRAQSCVMTPHPGELARLLGIPTEEVTADRFAAASEAVRRFGCAVLAKGAPSFVAAPGTPALVATTGHSGLATGGMGDTLGGVVAAMLAMGLDPPTGAAVALHFSGRAAELAGRGRGLLPRDVAEALPRALGEDTPERPESPFLLDLPLAR